MKLKKERCRKLVFTNVIVIICLCIINCATVYARMGGAEFKGYRNMKWPVPGYNNLSSCFFDEDAKTRGERSDYHYALDIATGGNKVNVVAAYEGTVVETVQNGRNDGGFGNQVIIRHNYTTRDGLTRTLYTHYSHLSSIGVSTNQQVSAGQYIGKTGGTASGGSPYGIHLDFQILTSANWRLYKTYSKDPFANEMLELPSNLYKGGNTACCDNYISEVKQLYSKPISNDSFISYLERPASGGTYSGPIAILGYALHKNGIRNVTAWVNGQVMDCPMYNSPDVAKVYPGYPTGNEGFQTQIPISCLKEGENEIGIYAYEKDDTPHLIASHKFNWSSFVSKLESPVQNGSYNGTLSIQGYTLHKNGIKNVTAWVNGQVMDCPMYERKEIATKYPGYPTGKEGFKTEIPLSCLKNGENEIGVFAYEPNGGTHNIASYKFNYVKENQKPIISNVKITDLTSAGYTVTCDVNASEGLSSVQFPTWSHTNGQDDLVWHEGTISGNKATCRINVSDHKGYVNCTYQTDIYAYDKAGNCTTYINGLLPYVDATPPTISNVEVVDVSETGYTIECTVKDDHSQIDRVQFPTWFGDDNPYASDGSWRTSESCKGKLINGKYTYRVNASDYGNRLGKYTTHIHAWDESGNQSAGYGTETIIKKTHKHDYTSSIKKAATCTEPGIMLYTCKDNDDSYEEEIPATGHQHPEERNVKAATCVQEGYIGDMYCKDCNAKLSSGRVLEKKPHTWNNGSITTAATCTEKGIKTYTCTICETTKTAEIPATGHQHTQLRNAKEATCAGAGYTGDTYCTDCGTKLSSGKSIPKTDHIWDAGKITKNATCTVSGIKTYTCISCKEIKKENIVATGHRNTEYRNVKAATCAEEGYSGDLYCKACNTKLRAGDKIAKKAHVWDNGAITRTATCTEKGVKTYTCANCKGTKVEEIPATGHQHTELQNVKEATTEEEGYTGDTYCADCGELIQKGTSIPKLTVNESAAVITVVGDKVAAGRDVTVSVDISKNSGIAGFSYDINYDEQAMTLKSVSAGDLISGNGQLSINKNVVNWYTSDNVNGDGNLLKIVFTVASDAQPSTYPVSLSLHDGKKNLVDENGTFVEANYVGGRIAVTRGMLGDLNGDDDITIADVVILNRHVLGKASISSDRLMFADITGDDDITIGDVVLLNRHVLGKVNILSEEMTALNELVLGTERVGGAENETGMKIYADDINIKAGTTVNIPVKISGNTGLAGFALTVQVPGGYTLNSIKAGNMLANGTFTVNGSNCTWYTADNMTANGVFMTLNVSASKAAKSGQIIIGVKDGKANNLSDEIGRTVAADFEPVTITIDMESECEINGHKGGTATCTEKAVCTVCGKDYGEVDPKNHTGQKETKNKKEATCTETGYTGDTYCKACGVKMSSGKSVAKTGHEWDAGVVTKKPTVTKTGVKTYTCKICKTTRTETIKATGVLPPGTVVKDTASNGTYKMAKDGLTLEFTKMISTTRKTLTIPSVVKVKGTSCKVTSIAANALKNNKTLEKVVIGSNISVIGSNAFSGCIKLTTVSGGSNITKYGDGAFYNCGKLKSISINKKATAIGAKAFYKCISLAKVTLPSTVKSIGSYAFYGCKNLKSITIGSTGLNSDKIGKDAFKGIYSKVTISVPRGKASAYKKFLISKGVSKSAIIK